MTERAHELAYELPLADGFVRDRAEMERRCQHYAAYALLHGNAVTFDLYRPAPDRGIERYPVTVSPKSARQLRVVGGAIEHLPDGVTHAFPGLSSTLLDAMADVVVVTDTTPSQFPGPLVLYCNAAFEEMTGYRRDELIGKTPRLLQGPDTREATRRKIAKGLQAWENIRCELVNYKKDGTPFRVELNISPAADATGWYTHWVAIQRDITLERRRGEMQAIANRVEVATTVASGIAHDLNNCLAVSASQLECLGESLSPAQRRELDRIVDSMVEMQGITRQFVSLNREREQAREQVSNLAEEVQRSVSVLPRRMKEVVSVRLASCENAYVRASPDAIGQVVLNLVLNAYQAVSQARRVPDIRIGLEHHAMDEGRAGLSLVVTDNGPGVPAELGPQIFSPYVTTKEAGSGLGLYNVARIAAEHEGTAFLRDSVPGDGASFEITFPVVEPPAPRAAVEVLGPDLEKRGHLLIVEDQEVLARAWSRTLAPYFDTIEVERTVDSAHAALESSPPDFLLCDMNLDLLEGGIEVVEVYRRIVPNGAFVITTGSPERVPAWVAPEALLEKPFRAQRLVEAIHAQRAKAEVPV